ncbi:unnamed protein product [Acanthoscelides obtectus]|uniref:Uncharacterized protein n=1 Tax=Acanthoscelides obtectus TaxID=200917 RepID=A0A9P0MJZ3_ACAOB|nr:unnamed protein product [Acanthoscelides obtectus]CAK1659867.1 hypothetical protein AOBTE_LOCUS21719 [Acanthoscelides obtectus]
MRRLLQTKTLYKPKPFDPEILGRNIFVSFLYLWRLREIHILFTNKCL